MTSYTLYAGGSVCAHMQFPHSDAKSVPHFYPRVTEKWNGNLNYSIPRKLYSTLESPLHSLFLPLSSEMMVIQLFLEMWTVVQETQLCKVPV